jgi:hypothetical protein
VDFYEDIEQETTAATSALALGLRVQFRRWNFDHSGFLSTLKIHEKRNCAASKRILDKRTDRRAFVPIVSDFTKFSPARSGSQ